MTQCPFLAPRASFGSNNDAPDHVNVNGSNYAAIGDDRRD
jgi:hypothetical protein